jgi:hypothetical protein
MRTGKEWVKGDVGLTPHTECANATANGHQTKAHQGRAPQGSADCYGAYVRAPDGIKNVACAAALTDLRLLR